MPKLLPDALSVDGWKELFEDIKNADSRASYFDIVRLATFSPALRFALDSEWHIGRMDESEARHHYAQQIEIAHGLKLFLLNDVEGERQDVYQVVKEAIIAAENSFIHFEALHLACGRILKADAELHPQLKHWLANHILGFDQPPDRKRGPDPYPKMERDKLLVYFFKYIEQLGYPITESVASFEHKSACHAVHEALTGHFDMPSVKRLMNIWSDRYSQK